MLYDFVHLLQHVIGQLLGLALLFQGPVFFNSAFVQVLSAFVLPGADTLGDEQTGTDNLPAMAQCVHAGNELTVRGDVYNLLNCQGFIVYHYLRVTLLNDGKQFVVDDHLDGARKGRPAQTAHAVLDVTARQVEQSGHE